MSGVFLTSVLSCLTALTQYAMSTTIPDRNYDIVNEYIVEEYDFRTEEPGLQPLFDEDLKWDFAYAGGHDAFQRPGLTEGRKAMTWALGIRGLKAAGNAIYYEADCMGLLIHPRVLMTLCACINSYYRSYKGLSPDDATDERFEESNTRDPDFDITTPSLYAYRTTWQGYTNYSGLQDEIAISRQILIAERCEEAIDVAPTEVEKITKQYKHAAFLLLTVPLTHPYDQSLPSYFDFIGQYEAVEYDREEPGWQDKVVFTNPPHTLQVMAYTQTPHPTDKQMVKERRIPAKRIPGTDEPVDFTKQLMIIHVGETINPAKTKEHYLYSCSYNYFKPYLLATELQRLKDAERLKAFSEEIRKNDAACMEWAWGGLCGAPPGSPIIYFNPKAKLDTLVGMTITRFENCSEELIYDAEKKHRTGMVYVFATILSKNGQGPYYYNFIKTLVKSIEDSNEPEKKLKREPERLVNDTGRAFIDFIGNLDPFLIPEMANALETNKLVNPRSNYGAGWIQPSNILFTVSIPLILH